MGDPVRCLPKVVHPDVAALKLQHNPNKSSFGTPPNRAGVPRGRSPAHGCSHRGSPPRGPRRTDASPTDRGTPRDVPRRSRCREPACGARLDVASIAHPLTTGPGPTDPSRPIRGSSGGSPRSVSPTRPSRRPVAESASAASSSPIRAFAPRSLAVGFANIVERRAESANHSSVRFSVATNGKFTVATNTPTTTQPAIAPASTVPPPAVAPPATTQRHVESIPW